MHLFYESHSQMFSSFTKIFKSNGNLSISSPSRPAKKQDLRLSPANRSDDHRVTVRVFSADLSSENRSSDELQVDTDINISDSLMLPSDVKIVENPPSPPRTTKLRSYVDITHTNHQRLKGLSFPEGMPMGPYKTFDEMYCAISDWAKNINTSGGSFSIVKNTHNPVTSRRGASRLLVCSRSGTSRSKLPNLHPLDIKRPNQNQTIKTDCKWAVYVEELCEGWMVTHPPEYAIDAAKLVENNSICLVHNHELCQSEAVKIMYANFREILDCLNDYATYLKRGRMSSSEIYHALVRECIERGMNVSFTAQDIKNKYGDTAEQSILDCTNLHEYLQQRLSNDPTLEYDIFIDEEGKLERIFLLCKMENACGRK